MFQVYVLTHQFALMSLTYSLLWCSSLNWANQIQFKFRQCNTLGFLQPWQAKSSTVNLGHPDCVCCGHLVLLWNCTIAFSSPSILTNSIFSGAVLVVTLSTERSSRLIRRYAVKHEHKHWLNIASYRIAAMGGWALPTLRSPLSTEGCVCAPWAVIAAGKFDGQKGFTQHQCETIASKARWTCTCELIGSNLYFYSSGAAYSDNK